MPTIKYPSTDLPAAGVDVGGRVTRGEAHHELQRRGDRLKEERGGGMYWLRKGAMIHYQHSASPDAFVPEERGGCEDQALL